MTGGAAKCGHVKDKSMEGPRDRGGDCNCRAPLRKRFQKHKKKKRAGKGGDMRVIDRARADFQMPRE